MPRTPTPGNHPYWKRCADAGETHLVIGHEMLGQVVEVGTDVTVVQPNDYAVFTVRRGCGHCAACAMNRSDMCYSGDVTAVAATGSAARVCIQPITDTTTLAPASL
ncbi:MAG: alcohol dehydrogenase catalytic domain-containing protein [Anaerolineae bacterium]|nr:alcohol dehydrogenase catalytic domain-containing protein [Anaerolineae bacterium]